MQFLFLEKKLFSGQRLIQEEPTKAASLLKEPPEDRGIYPPLIQVGNRHSKPAFGILFEPDFGRQRKPSRVQQIVGLVDRLLESVRRPHFVPIKPNPTGIEIESQ